MTTQILHLGCTSTRSDALHKIHAWAKKKDKSFTILSIKRHVSYRKEYTVRVEYFSANKEGKYRLGNWSWNDYCLEGKRYNLVKN